MREEWVVRQETVSLVSYIVNREENGVCVYVF